MVIDTEDSDKRLILLREDVGELGALLNIAYIALPQLLYTAESDYLMSAAESVDLLKEMLTSLKEDSIEVTTHKVTLDYSSLSSDAVLKVGNTIN